MPSAVRRSFLAERTLSRRKYQGTRANPVRTPLLLRLIVKCGGDQRFLANDMRWFLSIAAPEVKLCKVRLLCVIRMNVGMKYNPDSSLVFYLNFVGTPHAASSFVHALACYLTPVKVIPVPSATPFMGTTLSGCSVVISAAMRCEWTRLTWP